jgi:predicted nucleotidyltransferase
LARGDQVGTSDVDVLILVRHVWDAKPDEQVRRYYRFFDIPMGVDILVLDKESIDKRLKDGDRFISQLWAEQVELARC